MKAYKGFNKDMTCDPTGGNPFQYEEGKTYHTDEAELCESGFHACENPIDCLTYYNPAHSVYHEVELEEVTDEKSNDSKRCGKTIKIGARLTIAKIVELTIDFIKSKTNEKKDVQGNWSCAAAQGDQSCAEVNGKDSIAVGSGYQNKAKAGLGSAICLCERGDWNGNTYPLLAVKAAIVDGKILKPDTWYKLGNGEFVECEEE